MVTSFPRIPVVEISKPVNTFRLVHEKSPVLSQFADDDNELSFRERIKELIDRLSKTERTELSKPDAGELTYGVNSKIINMTFILSRGGGGMRFNDGKQEA